MGINLGSGAISKLYLGSTEIQKAYLGGTLVYDAAPSGLLLDDYPNAAAAYSLRQLRTGVTNVVRVRESGGNTEADFTATQITDGTLAAFCGANDGFVTVWYDQSGNSRDAVQSVATKQGYIFKSGEIQIFNGKPAIDSVNVVDFGFQTTGLTTFTDLDTFAVLQGHGTIFGGSGDIARIESGTGDILAYTSANVDFNNNTGNTEQLLYNLRKDNLGWYLHINSINYGFLAETSPLNVSNYILVYNGSVLEFQGKSTELILYPTDQTANRTAIENNINAHYGIY